MTAQRLVRRGLTDGSDVSRTVLLPGSVGVNQRLAPTDLKTADADLHHARELARHPFSLASTLVCDGCDQPLQPSRAPDGQRVYLFLCGCRRDFVDAELVERLARDRVEAASSRPADFGADGIGSVFRNIFASVRIGHGPEDLQFVWRM
ncbi:hypothetical protein AB0M46_13805 [Dactylosporangium sp. NPDC051485]|uniref:hypothetical protein n=1 Tax=Dactylosporangium sp. NPDC051485 TaxID=3154846 RepID=UPI003438828D